MEIPKYFYFRVKPNELDVVIEDASDVDVAEVVRCKDCAYWDNGTIRYNSGDSIGWDEAICDRFGEIGIRQNVWTGSNWYCADGERKGG